MIKSFGKGWCNWDNWPGMLHIKVLLKYLGSYGNEVSQQKISRAMGISNGAINDYLM